jgi:branched-chain amino acid transport system substrate-binding protein
MSLASHADTPGPLERVPAVCPGGTIGLRGRARAGVGGFCVIAALVLTAAPAEGADLSAARANFARQHYAEAHEIAISLLGSQRPDEARAARLIAAESAVELGQTAAAIELLGPLRTDRPPGPQDADWVRILARALQVQGSGAAAADWWLTYASLGAEEQAESQRQLAPLIDGGLSPAEMAYLLWKYPHQDLLCPAAVSYAAAEARTGHAREAARVQRAVRGRCGGTGAGPAAAPVAVDGSGGPDDAPAVDDFFTDFFTVGVLVPLNGRFAQYGIALANGVDTARRLHNARARFPLRIEIADTGGTPQGCLDALAGLYGRGVRVYIGELFSLHTLMASAFLRDRDAVLISPAATDSTVGLLGPGTYTCQVEAYEQLAAVTAYAADSLGVSGVAVYWPDSSPGRRLARLFSRVAAEQRLRVVGEQAYPPGTGDFADLPGVDGIPARLGGSIAPAAGAAVFCPGTLRELTGLVRQFAQAGFTGPFLGAPELGDPVLGELAAELGLTLVYPGPTFVSAVGPAGTPSFEETFQQLFAEEPGEFAQRGWIAFAVLADAIEAGGYCPEALQMRLEESAAPALARGEDRRLTVLPATGRAAVYLRSGAALRAAGRPEAPASRSAETETEPRR